MGDKMEIYLIRHGQTDANRQAIIQGRANNPLNFTGKKQARLTAQYLKEHQIEFDYCVSSPLLRAKETMNIIKDVLNLQIDTHIEADLIEREFGELDGKKIPENYFQMVHNGLVEGIETDETIEKRVRDFFNQFFKKHHHNRVLMVAHSHVIKALLVQYTSDFQYDTYLNNCSISRLTFDKLIKVIDYNMNPIKKANI
jgi:broad specificity phosphatase PhoE